MASNSEKIASITARIPKKVAIAVGALAIVAGCGGAYFYYVYLPQQQAAAKATTTASPAPRKPPVAKAASPASGVPATPKPAVVAGAGPATTAASAPAATTATAAPKPQLAATEKSKEPKTEPDKNSKGGKGVADVGKTDPKTTVTAAASHGEQNAAAPVKIAHKSVKRMRHKRNKQPVPAPVAVVTDVVAPEPPANVITTKFNDLITAVMYQDQAAVTELLDLGWWVDKPDPSGITPLMAAVNLGNTAIAELLLKRGANPNLISPRSGSALRLAKQNRDTGMTVLLQRHGATVE